MTHETYDVYLTDSALRAVGMFLGTAVYDPAHNTLTALAAEPRRQGAPALKPLPAAAQAALLRHLQDMLDQAKGQRHSEVFLLPAGARRSSGISSVFDLLNDDGEVRLGITIPRATDKIVSYLTGTDLDEVSIQRLKKDLHLQGLHSIAWRQARDMAVSRLPEWQRSGHRFVRVASGGYVHLQRSLPTQEMAA